MIAFAVFVMKSLPVPMSWMVLLRLSTRDFIVLGFIFKSLIYPELIFVYVVRKGYSFNLLHMATVLLLVWDYSCVPPHLDNFFVFLIDTVFHHISQDYLDLLTL